MRFAYARFIVSLAAIGTLATIISCKGKVRVPKVHRASGETCPELRGMPPEPNVGPGARPTGDECGKHADCTKRPNGRCYNGRGGARCNYDTCSSDADCAGGKGACKCRASAGAMEANVCYAQGNCRVDADCSGNYCSPSLGSCGHYGGIAGYFCHTRSDECIDDNDCTTGGKPGSCRYTPEVGHFKCNTSECAG